MENYEDRYVEAQETLGDLYTKLVNTYKNRTIAPQREAKDEFAARGAYGFIANAHQGVVMQFQALRKFLDTKLGPHSSARCNVNFLDAGCGIGNILVLAKETLLFPGKSHGIEFFPPTVELAREFTKLFSQPAIEIFQEDILTSDRYGEYDIIYYYCPLRDEEQQKKFETRVENQMKVGAYLLPHLKKDKKIRKDPRFIDITREVYGKTSPANWASSIWQKVEE